MIERAISIRQPYVELILLGKKVKEYRSRPTNIRERVYLYASLTAADDPAAWRKIGKEPGELPSGVIVGSAEIAGCEWDRDPYAYELRAPERPTEPLLAKNQPHPGFLAAPIRTR